MSTKPGRTVAVGSCYLDINLSNYPFPHSGIPAETELVGTEYELAAGGSAVNFCKLLHQFGLPATFLGMAGQGSNGDTLESLLRQSGVAPALIREPGLLTNLSFNMTNPQGQHIMLAAGTANAALLPGHVLPKLRELLPDATNLYLGGLFKLKGLMPAFEAIAGLAREHSVNLIIDHGRIPSHATGQMLAAVKQLVLTSTYYFPSRDEFLQLWNVPGITEGLRLLKEHSPHLTVIAKDGENGAFYLKGNDAQHVPARKVETVVHATGAGDTFNAAVITALAAGKPIRQAVDHGCRIAAAQISGRPLPPIQ